MNKASHHIAFTIFLLLLFSNVGAQDSVAIPPVVELGDTSVYEPSSSTNYQFKQVNEAKKVDVRNVPDQDLNKVKSDEDYWYANEAPHRKKQESVQKPRSSVFDMAWFNTLFWFILIGGFLALLIWFLATSNVSLFRRKLKTTEGENLAEVETENIFEINFENEIQKTISAGNYRLAVRLMYLRTLRDLSLRNVINYTHEKTNSDYLFQLAGSAYYKNFFRLTRNFDYTWYGHFPLSQEIFLVIQKDFESFKQQLS